MLQIWLILAGEKKNSAHWVLFNHRIPLRVKGKFYRTIVRLAIMFGLECWRIKKQHTQKMAMVEMTMLR